MLENPVVRARFKTWSVADYHRLFELGLIGEKFELLRRVILTKVRQSPLHCTVIGLLREALTVALPSDYYVREGQLLTLSDSEPEPDLAVVPGNPLEFSSAHPTSAPLVIEVVVHSEALDRLKIEIYAEAGVAECWLVLAEQRAVERHCDLAHGLYHRIERAVFPATLESTIFAGLRIPSPKTFGA